MGMSGSDFLGRRGYAGITDMIWCAENSNLGHVFLFTLIGNIGQGKNAAGEMIVQVNHAASYPSSASPAACIGVSGISGLILSRPGPDTTASLSYSSPLPRIKHDAANRNHNNLYKSPAGGTTARRPQEFGEAALP